MHTSELTKQNQDTKQVIFSAAAQLFARKGYNGVSMREISEQCGLSKPAIYYYFGSKEGIYEELIDTGLQHVFSSLDEIVVLNISAKEKLILMTKKFFQLTVEAPEFAKFFMTIVTPLSDNAILDKFKKKMKSQGGALAKVVQEGIKSGEFGAGAKPELAAQIIGGVWQHFVWQQLASEKRVLTDTLAEQVIEILFKGLNE